MRDSDTAPQGIAIIGMAVRLPGAADVDAYWRNLLDGVCAIRRTGEAEFPLGLTMTFSLSSSSSCGPRASGSLMIQEVDERHGVAWSQRRGRSLLGPRHSVALSQDTVDA